MNHAEYKCAIGCCSLLDMAMLGQKPHARYSLRLTAVCMEVLLYVFYMYSTYLCFLLLLFFCVCYMTGDFYIIVIIFVYISRKSEREEVKKE